MGLKIKTLNGVYVVDQAPNGGWAWVIVFAAFNNMGFGFGIPKTMGVFFNEMKQDLGVSNAAISWLLTAILSVIYTFSGFVAQVLKKRIDERQIVMIGGILSCSGMSICSIAPNIFVMYFGGILAGLGYGLSSLLCFSQLALYFSSYTALANAIALSGSTLYGAAAPYLAQYLMDLYTWRGAMFILGGIGLNSCACGALLRPITLERKSHVIEEVQISEETHNKTENTQPERYTHFARKYWLAIGCWCTMFLYSITMYLPNVYVVPFALEQNLAENQSVVLLSIISVGDFAGRFFSGVLISNLDFINKRPLQTTSIFFWVICVIQLIPAMSSNFEILVLYCLIYGVAFGGISTCTFTIVSKYFPKQILATAFSWFFAAGGFGLLISGVLSGAIVDWIGNFRSVFWLTMIFLALSALWCTLCVFITLCWNDGNIVIEVKEKTSAK